MYDKLRRSFYLHNLTFQCIGPPLPLAEDIKRLSLKPQGSEANFLTVHLCPIMEISVAIPGRFCNVIKILSLNAQCQVVTSHQQTHGCCMLMVFYKWLHLMKLVERFCVLCNLFRFGVERFWPQHSWHHCCLFLLAKFDVCGIILFMSLVFYICVVSIVEELYLPPLCVNGQNYWSFSDVL